MPPRYPIEYPHERALVRRYFPNVTEPAVGEVARILHERIVADPNATDMASVSISVALAMLRHQERKET